jgi:hypothetical protein
MYDSFSKISRPSTGLQSRLFLKNIVPFSKILRTFYASRNLWIIVVFLQRTLKEKLRFFLINTLLLYIPLLALTDRITDRESNTLATRGLEEPYFQLCCCASIWFWWEIGFGFTNYIYMYSKYNTVVVLC